MAEAEPVDGKYEEKRKQLVFLGEVITSVGY